MILSDLHYTFMIFLLNDSQSIYYHKTTCYANILQQFFDTLFQYSSTRLRLFPVLSYLKISHPNIVVLKHILQKKSTFPHPICENFRYCHIKKQVLESRYKAKALGKSPGRLFSLHMVFLWQRSRTGIVPGTALLH